MKNITVYDFGNGVLDRYTIIKDNDFALNYEEFPSMFTGRYLYNCICASEFGAGVFMWGTAKKGRHLGKKVPFESLRPELQERIKDAYKD